MQIPADETPAAKPAIPSLAELREGIIRRSEQETIEANAVTRRDMAISALLCLCWCAGGLFLIAWSFHTTDLTLGKGAFWLGVGAGNGGIIFTLLGAYRRGERRGDW